jgi:hypothetical protein
MLNGKRKLLTMMLALVIFAAAYVGYDAWERSIFAKRSPIAAGLPRSEEQANAQFRDRVYQRFAAGLSAAEAMRELLAQGFIGPQGASNSVLPGPAEPLKSFNAGFTLVRHSSWLLNCRQRWDISWATTPQGRMVSLNAQYQHICAYPSWATSLASLRARRATARSISAHMSFPMLGSSASRYLSQAGRMNGCGG